MLHIAAPFPVVPGNPVNATTFDFPVLYGEVRGLTGAEVISGDPGGAAKLVEAAKALEAAGVCAIAGACGSFANFQQELRAALNVPVFASVMTLAPQILSSLPPSKSLGIVFADAGAFTDRVRAQCGIAPDAPIHVTDVCEHDGFARLIGGASDFDEMDFVEYFDQRMHSFIDAHPDIGAIVIQCNELIPYAWSIQRRADVPVFDVAGLVRWLHASCALTPPAGHVYGLEPVNR